MIDPAITGGPARLFHAPIEGLRRGFAQAQSAAEKIAAGDVSPETIVGQIQAGAMVQASASVVRTTDDMLGSLLDALA